MDREAQIEAAWAAWQGRHSTQKRPQNRPQWMTPQERATLAEAQNWRCCYCGCRMDGEGQEPTAPTFEHVIPLTLGGGNVRENVVVACLGCNSSRGSRLRAEHAEALLAMTKDQRRALLAPRLPLGRSAA